MPAYDTCLEVVHEGASPLTGRSEFRIGRITSPEFGKAGPVEALQHKALSSPHNLNSHDSSDGLIQELVWREGLAVASLRPAAGGGIEIFNISSDHLGTPRVIRRATDGVIVWRWDSDPFGVASPNENPSGAGEFK